MPLFNCSVQNCNKPGVRGGCCKLCNRNLCTDHLRPSFHRCPDWENEEPAWREANERARRQEVERLLSQLNVDALKARASALKRGVRCNIPSLQYNKATINDMMGGTNYHIPITFEDGDTWICRIRRSNVTAPAADLQNRIIQSEVATLKFLATTRVPVPAVHDFGLSARDNPIGVPYILMDRIKGRPFYWPDMLPFQKHKVLQQWADIAIELSQHPFSSIGCLLPSGRSSWSAGPIVFEHHAERDQNGQLLLPGPFSSSTPYRRDIILRHLELIRTGQTRPKRRLDSYLMHLFLLECVPLIAQHEEPSGGGFYLKHMDDKGDHILIDDDANITGIIDWEWAQTCPKAEAFSAPLCLLPVVDYHNGYNMVGEDEARFADILESKGARELAGYVHNGRIEHRISHCIGCDIDDKSSFGKMFTALRAVLNDSQDNVVQDWQTWKRQALVKYQQDKGLQGILKSESEADTADVYISDSPAVSYNFALR